MHRLLGSLVGALATAALYAGSAAPALAQAADLAICKGEDAYAGIPACTRLIERGTRLSPAERAAAFFHRSSHYHTKGDGDRRLRDLDEAIRLQPKHAQAWSARAWVYFWQGDHARAFRELDEAIRLEPSADHYRERGSAAYQLESRSRRKSCRRSGCARSRRWSSRVRGAGALPARSFRSWPTTFNRGCAGRCRSGGRTIPVWSR